jgi:hypothetical protein
MPWLTEVSNTLGRAHPYILETTEFGRNLSQSSARIAHLREMLLSPKWLRRERVVDPLQARWPPRVKAAALSSEVGAQAELKPVYLSTRRKSLMLVTSLLRRIQQYKEVPSTVGVFPVGVPVWSCTCSLWVSPMKHGQVSSHLSGSSALKQRPRLTWRFVRAKALGV